MDKVIEILSRSTDSRTSQDLSVLIKETCLIAFFKKIGPEAHEKCCSRMFLLELLEGDYVFKQGDNGTTFYIILQGTVGIEIEFLQKTLQPNGEMKEEYKPTEVAKLAPGMSFGELALIDNAPRSASVKCKTNATFAVLDKKAYKEILQEIERKRLDEKASFLHQIFPFLTKRHMNTLVYFCKEESFPKNKTVFKEGDEVKSLYIIREGEVTLSKFFRVVKRSQEEEENRLPAMTFMAKEGKAMDIAKLGPRQLLNIEEIQKGSKLQSYTATASSFDQLKVFIMAKGDFEKKVRMNNELEVDAFLKAISLGKSTTINNAIERIEEIAIGKNANFLGQFPPQKNKEEEIEIKNNETKVKHKVYDIDRLKKGTRAMVLKEIEAKSEKSQEDQEAPKNKNRKISFDEEHGVAGQKESVFMTNARVVESRMSLEENESTPKRDAWTGNWAQMEKTCYEEMNFTKGVKFAETFQEKDEGQAKEKRKMESMMNEVSFQTDQLYRKMFDTTGSKGWIVSQKEQAKQEEKASLTDGFSRGTRNDMRSTMARTPLESSYRPENASFRLRDPGESSFRPGNSQKNNSGMSKNIIKSPRPNPREIKTANVGVRRANYILDERPVSHESSFRDFDNIKPKNFNKTLTVPSKNAERTSRMRSRVFDTNEKFKKSLTIGRTGDQTLKNAFEQFEANEAQKGEKEDQIITGEENPKRGDEEIQKPFSVYDYEGKKPKVSGKKSNKRANVWSADVRIRTSHSANKKSSKDSEKKTKEQFACMEELVAFISMGQGEENHRGMHLEHVLNSRKPTEKPQEILAIVENSAVLLKKKHGLLSNGNQEYSLMQYSDNLDDYDHLKKKSGRDCQRIEEIFAQGDELVSQLAFSQKMKLLERKYESKKLSFDSHRQVERFFLGLKKKHRNNPYAYFPEKESLE